MPGLVDNLRKNAMDTKIKELIAVASSVATNCIPCLDFHIQKARQLGASEKDLIIATKIALQVKTGATTKIEDAVNNNLAGFKQTSVENVCDCSD